MFLHIIADKVRLAQACVSRARLNRVVAIIGILTVVATAAHAQTYYVDSSAGDDANSGITSSAPWRSIGKVNASKFQPGDFILFKRGCIWREILIIPSSGTAGYPITFGAYGTGAKPVISGADIVGARGWSLYTGNIYVTSVVGIYSSPTQLYVNGEYYDIAQYPNSGYLLATANSSNQYTITDKNLSLTVDKVVGATVMARDMPWLIDISTASAFNLMTRTITLKTALSYAMQAGCGFYLQNKLWMLDSQKEWYFDLKTGRLYLWAAGGGIPDGFMVEISNRSYGIVNAAKTYVTISGLAVNASNRYNLYISGATNVIVDSCEFSGGQVGLYLSRTSNSSIRNNIFRNTLSTGIMTDSNAVDNVELLNNTVVNAGNVGTSPKGSLAAIYVNGENISIINNSVGNSGYVGISFTGNRISIQDNVVDRSCLRLDDCGGIYTGKNNGINTITGNTITNSIGNLNGKIHKFTQAHGIYLDDFAHNLNVSNNIVSGADYGIFIHTGYNNTVTGNTVYNARMNGILINENSVGAVPGTVRDNLVKYNTFENTSTGATAFFYSAIGSTAKFGTFDNNRYCHPNSVFTVRNQSQNYTLSAWQHASGQDLKSTDTKALCAAPVPTLTLAANPARVAYGGTTTLTWASANAISCSASGSWSGAKAASGSLDITGVTGGRTYKLTCSGRGGTVTRSATVTVK